MEIISSAANLEYVNRRLKAFANNGRVAQHKDRKEHVWENTASYSGQPPRSVTFQGDISKAVDADQTWVEKRWPEKSFPLIHEALQSTRDPAQESSKIPQSHERGASYESQPGDGFDLDLVSPNSQIPCEAPGCPITGPHNLGKYYHDGEQPHTPEEWEFKTSTGLTKAPVSHFFNYTVPPPFIVGAYTRMTENKASQLEQDQVRNYQMNHMYSPLISETPTPRARSECTHPVPIFCSIVAPEAASQRHERVITEQLKQAESGGAEVKESQLGPREDHYQRPHPEEGRTISKAFDMMRDIRQPLMKRLRLSRKGRPTAKVHTVDFDDTNDHSLKEKDHVCMQDHEQGDNESADQEAAPMGNARIFDVLGPRRRPSARKIPQGFELEEVQLDLQEGILGEIAYEAINDAYNDPDDIRSGRRPGGSPPSDTEGPEDLDRELEVISELMKALQRHLKDNSYQDLHLVNPNGQDETPNAKFAIIHDIELILRRAFRVTLAKFTRPYRPTGSPVRAQEMDDEFEVQLSVREALMRQYPRLTVREMVASLDRVGHGADMKTMAGM